MPTYCPKVAELLLMSTATSQNAPALRVPACPVQTAAVGNVEAAQHTLGAAAVVVLHKLQAGASGLVKRFLVKALIKKSTTVAEYFGLDDEYLRDSSGCSFQLVIPSRNIRNMFLP